MTDNKPTPKQIDALTAIRAGQVTMRNCGSAAFRILGPAHPSVVGMCVKNGWAKWPKGPIGEQTCELTAAGRLLDGAEHNTDLEVSHD
ncbi:hypothetical protein [Telmatospirillum sp.]|uniref:hypothetical protein n=1 Tax=Telmatospirillum sp. TaxID=2079197 RepID=UPI00283B25CA|nr:hypothetical protein [Telmatospirillum sp.]MDR3439844.1 hypothetical protein [Telmatospirillum sp.]